MTKPNNGSAIALQKEGLDEQRRMNLFQMQFMKRQQKAMEAQQPQPYRPQPAIPTPGRANADEARIDLRERMKRKFGMGKTIIGGAAAA